MYHVLLATNENLAIVYLYEAILAYSYSISVKNYH